MRRSTASLLNLASRHVFLKPQLLHCTPAVACLNTFVGNIFGNRSPERLRPAALAGGLPRSNLDPLTFHGNTLASLLRQDLAAFPVSPGMMQQPLLPQQHNVLQDRLAHGTALAHQQQAMATTRPREPPISLRDRIDATPTTPVRSSKSDTVSMKAQVIFDASWKKMEARFKDSYVCPREVVWLNGAPGAGKGTNVPFIMRSRGLSRALGMSQLLDSSPEIRTIIDKGDLVPDGLVLDALLDAILNPELNDGAGLVIDGFPRTATQVDFVKALHDKLLESHHRAADGPDEWRFPRPSFKVVILYVDEEESLRRQTKRAHLASLHNRRVLDAGTGDVWNVRSTDINEALCRRRYQVFKAHYTTILRLKSYFPFSLIDAMGSLEETRAQIVRELRYQSSLDLDVKTYAAIRHLPLAKDLVRVARQRLVFRLDSYCKRHPTLFADVIALIDADVIPLLKQCSLAGHAEFKTRHPLLLGNSMAVDILIDVLTDRGFSVAHAQENRLKPLRVNLTTGDVECEEEGVHAFRITFDKENVRDLSTPAAVTTRHGESVAIGTTWVPEHLRRGDEDREAEGLRGYLEINEKKHQLKTVVAAAESQRAANAAANSNAGATDAETGNKAAMPAVNFGDGTRTGTNGLTKKDEFGSKRATDSVNGSFTDDIPFLRGWDSMDPELNPYNRARQYGFECMNERED